MPHKSRSHKWSKKVIKCLVQREFFFPGEQTNFVQQKFVFVLSHYFAEKKEEWISNRGGYLSTEGAAGTNFHAVDCHAHLEEQKMH